jgi:signal transduction histidine kinase
MRIVLAAGDGVSSVEVRDDGAGIPTDATERIFDAFVRVPTGQPNPASVGLGLSVSRDLARLMGGDLLYHRDGDETVFELRLPLADTG